MHFKYCPECGALLVDRDAGDDGKVPYCESCGKYWFDQFASCVIVLIYNEFDEIVLSRQNYLSEKYAVFTSGFITPGETAEEAVKREVKEELGLDLEEPEYAGTFWLARRDQLMHCFLGFCRKKPLVLSPELDGAEWVPAMDVPKYVYPERAGTAIYPMYRRFLKKRGLAEPGKGSEPE
ncbi:MAG: NUDIX domain-containing protein [Lachnospiraceae bacterium]|nr:NUDIX domain-containing protein [Lachnospiraceae bacterium]